MNVKWIHYTKRLEIYKESNEKLNEKRLINQETYSEYMDMNKSLLLTLLKEKNKFDQGWNFFVQELFFVKNDDNLPNCLTKVDYPPFLDTSKLETLKTLEILSNRFKLDFSESINLQSYLYQVFLSDILNIN